MAGFMGAVGFVGFVGFVGVVGVAGCCRVWWVLQELSTEIKKKFFSFFTLTPSQIWLKRPVYRGFKGEGRCEGRAFALTLTLTLPSHFRQESIQSGIPWMSEAKVPEKYSYLVPTVQGCCTFGARVLHFYWHY